VRSDSTTEHASKNLQSESTIQENIVENVKEASANTFDEFHASYDAEHSNNKRPIGRKMAKASALKSENRGVMLVRSLLARI
jgi:hypothetical protein